MSKKTYRVWIDQVNRSIVEVKATDSKDALDKAYRKWRKEYAHAGIGQIEEVKTPKP